MTAPYFHNGFAENLEQAILQHLDPLQHGNDYREDGAHLMSEDQLNAISLTLFPRVDLWEGGIEDIISFLEALEDANALSDPRIVPEKVPSNLTISVGR